MEKQKNIKKRKKPQSTQTIRIGEGGSGCVVQSPLEENKVWKMKKMRKQQKKFSLSKDDKSTTMEETSSSSCVSKSSFTHRMNEFKKEYLLQKVAAEAISSYTPKVYQLKYISEQKYRLKGYSPWVIEMEKIKGETLATQHLQKNGLVYEDLVNIFKQFATALSLLHDYQMIHGDLSPSNVMYNKEQQKLYMIDFGLSAIGRKTYPSRGGTHGFQEYRFDYDNHSEWFSYGMILFRCLTGTKTSIFFDNKGLLQTKFLQRMIRDLNARDFYFVAILVYSRFLKDIQEDKKRIVVLEQKWFDLEWNASFVDLYLHMVRENQDVMKCTLPEVKLVLELQSEHAWPMNYKNITRDVLRLRIGKEKENQSSELFMKRIFEYIEGHG